MWLALCFALESQVYRNSLKMLAENLFLSSGSADDKATPSPAESMSSGVFLVSKLLNVWLKLIQTVEKSPLNTQIFSFHLGVLCFPLSLGSC